MRIHGFETFGGSQVEPSAVNLLHVPSIFSPQDFSISRKILYGFSKHVCLSNASLSFYGVRFFALLLIFSYAFSHFTITYYRRKNRNITMDLNFEILTNRRLSRSLNFANQGTGARFVKIHFCILFNHYGIETQQATG